MRAGARNAARRAGRQAGWELVAGAAYVVCPFTTAPMIEAWARGLHVVLEEAGHEKPSKYVSPPGLPGEWGVAALAANGPLETAWADGFATGTREARELVADGSHTVKDLEAWARGLEKWGVFGHDDDASWAWSKGRASALRKVAREMRGDAGSGHDDKR